MRLRDAVQLLETLRHNLNKNTQPVHRGGGLQHDATRMLSCIRLMMQVRNRNQLPIVVSRALEAALPGLSSVVGDEAAASQALPSASTLSRSQCSLDAAILEGERDHLAASARRQFPTMWM